MQKRSRQGLLLLLLVVIAGTFLLLEGIPDDLRSGPSAVEAPSSPAEPTGELAGNVVTPPAASSTPADPELQDGTAREDVPFPALRCSIQDPFGNPLEHALVTWSPWRAPTDNTLPSFADTDIDGLLNQTLAATSDPEGLTEFERPPPFALEGRSVIWASLGGYLAAFEVLESSDPAESRHHCFVLAECEVFEVSVAEASGEPVPGAEVLQLGVPFSEAQRMVFLNRPPGPDEAAMLLADAANCSFCREYETDSDGRTRIVYGEWPTLVWARRGSERSQFFLVRPERKQVVLHLGTLVSVSGAVILTGGGALPPGPIVQCTLEVGGRGQALGTCRVREDGGWGPLEVPHRGEGTYVFRLSGGGVVVQREERQAPLAIDSSRIDFSTEMGVRQEVLVRDDQGAAIADAHVEIIWSVGEDWVRAHGWTDEEGLATLEGCSSTTSWLRAGKQGYIEKTEGNVAIPRPIEEMVMVLEKAARLTGTVRSAGEPVTEFQVITWEDTPLDSKSTAFFDRKDGSFELDQVQTGSIKVMASSDDLPESEVQVVEIEPGSESHVEVELDPGTTGSGTVVDALSGEPLPGASVQLLNCYQTHSLGPRRAEQSVEPDGSFTLEAVSPVEASLRVSSPGYVSTQAYGTPGPDGTIVFGVIPLGKLHTLQVDLVGDLPLDDADPVWFSATGRPGRNIPYLRVPLDGHLEIPDVPPGSYVCLLTYEDGSIQTCRSNLTPGGRWHVEFPFTKGHSIRVEVRGADGDPVPPVEVWANWRRENGRWSSRAAVTGADGSATMDFMPTGPVTFVVYDTTNREVLSATGRVLEPPSPQAIGLRLEQRGVRVRVIDEKGNPRPRAMVALSCELGSGQWTAHHLVDSNGYAAFHGLDAETVMLVAFEASAGLSLEEVKLVPDRTTEVEMVIGTGDDMQVIASDHGQGVAGAKLSAIPVGFTYDEILFGSTDTHGEKTWPSVAPGDYTIHLSRYGYWPATHTIHFEGDSPIHLPIRRRGNLEATITRSGSTPVPGARLRLHSAEFEATVTDWLTTGKLAPDAVQLTADASGRVFAHGIPHGIYQWTATAPDGTTSNGELTVPPGATRAASLVLDGA